MKKAYCNIANGRKVINLGVRKQQGERPYSGLLGLPQSGQRPLLPLGLGEDGVAVGGKGRQHCSDVHTVLFSTVRQPVSLAVRVADRRAQGGECTEQKPWGRGAGAGGGLRNEPYMLRDVKG
jgi:hypothetical protein